MVPLRLSAVHLRSAILHKGLFVEAGDDALQHLRRALHQLTGRAPRAWCRLTPAAVPASSCRADGHACPQGS